MATPKKGGKKSGSKKNTKGVQKKSGLTFPTGRIGTMLRKGRYQRRVSQGAHARPVDLALVEVLAELHRLVEEAAHREVEEGLAMHRLGGSGGLHAEAGVAALLEAEQGRVVAFTDQRLDVLEVQLAEAEALREAIQQLMGDQEVPDDLHQARAQPIDL